MAAASGSFPLPPADLHRHALPKKTLRAGALGYRSHNVAKGPIFFGPKDTIPVFRFDDPAGAFKTCYVGGSDVAAFVETFLRELPTRTVSRGLLQQRAISTLEMLRDVKLVATHGRHLARLGTTAAIWGGKNIGAANPYLHSQDWARAFYDHPDAVDGIEYKSSHDDELICYAFFDRARDALGDQGDAQVIGDNHALLRPLLKRYRLELL